MESSVCDAAFKPDFPQSLKLDNGERDRNMQRQGQKQRKISNRDMEIKRQTSIEQESIKAEYTVQCRTRGV